MIIKATRICEGWFKYTTNYKSSLIVAGRKILSVKDTKLPNPIFEACRLIENDL